MQFSFATANNIIFGAGTVNRAADEAARLGRRVLLVTGGNAARTVDFVRRLEKSGLNAVRFAIAGEPTVEQVAQGAALARREKCDLVIGFGGGSALDGAKAIAALAVNTDPVENYLEVFGQGLPLPHPPLPCVAIPTTAGTGCEVTRNAVLKSVRHQVKVSLRSPLMLPVLAVVDPVLTLSLPPAVTAATGCDALTQLLEALVSAKANPMTDALCREALPWAARSLPKAMARPDDLDARGDMCLASLFSGLALANGGLGAVHGIAGPLGGMMAAPHGAICARLLPFVTEANVAVLSRSISHNAALQRFSQVARLVLDSPRATKDDLIQWLHALVKQLKIPPLKHWGLGPADVPALVAKAQAASSMKGNPVVLTESELGDIVLKAL